MSEIIIKNGNAKIKPLLEDVLLTEKKIVMSAIKRTKAILTKFEEKYGISSDVFSKNIRKGRWETIWIW